ncbi:hypothetical protein Bbelb_149200 [Branchiostoma belcheri]|nr:hypothetical protein Bbelb_149200 [Branchiostoma belcheri]
MSNLRTDCITRNFPNIVRIPIKVRTPDLGLVGDKYSRLKPDLQDVTTASMDKASAAKRSQLWIPESRPPIDPRGANNRRGGDLSGVMMLLSNGTNTGATPVGAYRLDPPTGRALPVPVFRYIPGSSTDLSGENLK